MPSGSCLCGAIKYSYDGSPSLSALCHCLTCRKLTSTAAAMTALIPDAAFQTTSRSSPSYKTYTTKHESGIPLTYSFCGDCSTVCWKTAAEGFPGHHIVFLGTLDDKDAFEKCKPDAEIWIKYRVPWLKSLEDGGVGQFVGFPEN